MFKSTNGRPQDSLNHPAGFLHARLPLGCGVWPGPILTLRPWVTWLDRGLVSSNQTPFSALVSAGSRRRQEAPMPWSAGASAYPQSRRSFPPASSAAQPCPPAHRWRCGGTIALKTGGAAPIATTPARSRHDRGPTACEGVTLLTGRLKDRPLRPERLEEVLVTDRGRVPPSGVARR